MIHDLCFGDELSAKTIRNIDSMLSGSLSYALDTEYIAKNPCVRVKLPAEQLQIQRNLYAKNTDGAQNYDKYYLS
ncbi:MAG: hypothetical protein LBF68_07805 [Christensenellaceae bacterium]|jgi:hypothetical protein|nr:hypothetical protein [Christensenellaceae bacterium]